MKYNSETLIKELIDYTQSFIEKAETFKGLPLEVLNMRESEKSWSILECIEHLNLYGDFYLKELEDRILTARHGSEIDFKSTWFGNRTALSMLPVEDKKLNSMNAFKDKNPVNSNLSVVNVDRFIKQQKTLLSLLEQAKKVSLTKTKTKTTLPLIKFRLGDTLRFVIYHNVRHIIQAENMLSRQKTEL
ncbi:MAG: DinB family protein [Salibacteraceae bacterium]